MEKPNIFNYATSELSQDAVLIWLANWAKPDYSNKNEKLHKTGKYFLNSLLKKAEKSFNHFDEINVIPQHHKIDVFIELKVENQKIAIIIEDKIKSSEHSNQLTKYYNKISQKYTKEQIIPIYLKTGFQHNFDNVSKTGYFLYSINDLMSVFEFGRNLNIENDIFLDFHAYLSQLKEQFENDKKSFENFPSKKIKDWNWWNWIGFFDKHKHSLNAKWKIIPNSREPLVSLWFGRTTETIIKEGEKISFRSYIDIKYSGRNYYAFSYRLDLNGNPQNNKKLRDEIIQRIKGRIEGNKIEVQIPRFRKAKNTIELLKVVNINKDMDENQVVGFLKELERILKGR